MLTATDPLPRRPRRVLVAGVSGSGKSTLARRIAAVLHVPYTELDSLFHGPGWTPRPEFEAEVAAIAAADGWVSEWQYDAVRPLLASRADLLVWLDLPFPLVLGRVVRRTVGRRLRREVLWNGNQEPPMRTFFTDPEHIVRWAIRSRHKMRERAPRLAAEHPRLLVVRLRSTGEVDRWVRDVLEPLA